MWGWPPSTTRKQRLGDLFAVADDAHERLNREG
jgi:hypothetical protein